jgi:CRISPR-associated protein Csd2
MTSAATNKDEATKMTSKESKESDFNRRVDLVLITVAYNSNLQGSPDDDNARRIDEDGYGYCTPQGPKYKHRRAIEVMTGKQMFIAGDVPLAVKMTEASERAGVAPEKNKVAKNSKQAAIDEVLSAYWDCRAFGAVLTNPIDRGVTGPIQVGWSRSHEKLSVETVTIRCEAIRNEQDAKVKSNELGSTSVVPFEVLITPYSICPQRAKQTHFTNEDYALFLKSFSMMYQVTNATGRALVYAHTLVLFEHESPLGNDQACKLFERVRVTHEDNPASAVIHKKVNVAVDQTDLPKGIKVTIVQL